MRGERASTWNSPRQPNYDPPDLPTDANPMSTPEPQDPAEREVESELDLAFAPLHKRCLGLAVGATLAVIVLAATVLHLLRSPGEPYPLVLLEQYFPGYAVTWGGALLGAFWAFWLGFVLGWSFAFLRNLVMAITAFVFRARAELNESRGFLDHI